MFILTHVRNHEASTEYFQKMEKAVERANYIMKQFMGNWEDRSEVVYEPNLQIFRLWRDWDYDNHIVSIEPIVWSD